MSASPKKYCARCGREVMQTMRICPAAGCGSRDFVAEDPSTVTQRATHADSPAPKYCVLCGHEVMRTIRICPTVGCGGRDFTDRRPERTIPRVAGAPAPATLTQVGRSHQVLQRVTATAASVAALAAVVAVVLVVHPHSTAKPVVAETTPTPGDIETPQATDVAVVQASAPPTISQTSEAAVVLPTPVTVAGGAECYQDTVSAVDAGTRVVTVGRNDLYRVDGDAGELSWKAGDPIAVCLGEGTGYVLRADDQTVQAQSVTPDRAATDESGGTSVAQPVSAAATVPVAIPYVPPTMPSIPITVPNTVTVPLTVPSIAPAFVPVRPFEPIRPP